MKIVKLPKELEKEYEQMISYFTGPQGFMIRNKYAETVCRILTIFQNLNLSKLKISDPDYQFLESHHMRPRKMDGSDEDWNRVNLPSKVHFICHLLYVNCTADEIQIEMMKTIRYMMDIPLYEMKNINSKLFQKIRDEWHKNLCRTNVEKFGIEKAAAISLRISKAKLGITLEEMHGPEKAKQLNDEQSKSKTGVSLEQRLGFEEAEKIKNQMKKCHTGSKQPRQFFETRCDIYRLINLKTGQYEDMLHSKTLLKQKFPEINPDRILRQMNKGTEITVIEELKDYQFVLLSEDQLDDLNYQPIGILTKEEIKLIHKPDISNQNTPKKYYMITSPDLNYEILLGIQTVFDNFDTDMIRLRFYISGKETIISGIEKLIGHKVIKLGRKLPTNEEIQNHLDQYRIEYEEWCMKGEGNSYKCRILFPDMTFEDFPSRLQLRKIHPINDRKIQKLLGSEELITNLPALENCKIIKLPRMGFTDQEFDKILKDYYLQLKSIHQ